MSQTTAGLSTLAQQIGDRVRVKRVGVDDKGLVAMAS